MGNLKEFRERVHDLYRRTSPYGDERRTTQRDLAAAVALSPAELSKRLNGAQGTHLSQRDIQAIVRTLAAWQAIHTRAQALELLTLLDCPPFSEAEWQAPPLDLLTEPAPAPVVNPLTALPATSLLMPLTSFVGREQERTRVEQLLAATRLLTLTGTGGVGKTRLAVQVAANLTASFAGGVLLIELAPVAEPGLVPPTLAASLGLREEPGRLLITTIADYLYGKRVLLLLDNCEHLTRACAELADTLLRRCPQLSILATSREPLGVAGETTYRVPSLSVPVASVTMQVAELYRYESSQLFVKRAQSADPDFEVGARDVIAVAEICAYLDGIPLAIELAAAQVRALTAQQIAAGLADRLCRLPGGSHTSPPRQQTIRASVEWSYSRLASREQSVLRRLAIFAAGWLLEAAEQVCTADDLPPAMVQEALIQLVNKSMVNMERRGGQARYTMLESIRQYALEELAAAGELAAVQQRCATYYLNLAEEAEQKLLGAEQQSWLACLDLEHDNLRAVLTALLVRGDKVLTLRLLNALWKFWHIRAYFSEWQQWLATARALSGPVPAEVEARTLSALGLLNLTRAEYPQARAAFEQALALWRSLHSKRGEATILNNLALVAEYQGDYTLATRLLEESLTLMQEVGSTSVIASLLNNLGKVAQEQGEYDRAASLLEESILVWQSLGDERSIATAQNNLALVTLHQGDYVTARRLLCSSLTMRRALKDRWGVAASLEGTACLLAVLGQPETAVHLFGCAAVICEAVGLPTPLIGLSSYQQGLTLVRQQLSAEGLTRLWQVGRTAEEEQVVAAALAALAG